MPVYRRWKQVGGISIADLPVAVWLPETKAVVLADADTTVDDWTALYGSLPYATHVLEAPAATNRPEWLAGAGVGGRNRIRFNGVDNVLNITLTKGSNWTGWEAGFAGELNSDGSTADRVFGYSSFQRVEEASTANTLRGNSGAGGASVNFATTALATAHYSMDWTTGAQNNRVNGAISGSGAPAALSRADALILSVGALFDGTGASNLDFDAFYVATRPFTVDERARFRAWLTARVGYSC